MSQQRRPPSPVEASAAAVGLGVLVFASPLRELWARPALGPLAPFVAWIAVVVAGGLLLGAASRSRE